ncbi:hypothetical protein AVEN_76672-1 [Araneus ventricosus]|uniref:Reverse transcriptase domain-containing protein n=1 Tax=Araneus ventricosus TaxID=182803 RepID=A0A4Y2BPE7_ARAVE|nr:hypothetical protein AVEN_76672-1 [Araneus ventricosus]
MQFSVYRIFLRITEFRFNPLKSVTGFFTTNRHLYRYSPKISLNGHILQCERNPKYLGFVLDPGITRNKHINLLVTKAKKRLNILKFIFSCDWGADAGTLRTTCISVIRPILEYSYQVYRVTSDANLDKLERIQLSAARIVTGLRSSTLADIVLDEADLQPLHLRSTHNLRKYFSRLFNYNNQHRTANFLRSWQNNQRLKKSSPLGYALKIDALHSLVEFNSLIPIVSQLDSLLNVFFHTELLTHTNKSSQHSEYLRQAALEVINNIPIEATLIYTDGSKNEIRHTDSGVLLSTVGGGRELLLNEEMLTTAQFSAPK